MIPIKCPRCGQIQDVGSAFENEFERRCGACGYHLSFGRGRSWRKVLLGLVATFMAWYLEMPSGLIILGAVLTIIAALGAILLRGKENEAPTQPAKRQQKIRQVVGMWQSQAMQAAEQKVESLIHQQAPVSEIIEAVEHAAKLAKQICGENSPEAAGWLRRLGYYYIEVGNPEAEPCLQRALETNQRVFGPSDPHVAVVFSDLGEVYSKLGRLDEAESHYQKALSIHMRAYGPDHPETLTTKTGLALVRLERYDPSRSEWVEARNNLEEILEADLKRHGPNHPLVATDRVNLASVLHEEGRWEEAESEVRHALHFAETYCPDQTETIANRLVVLADMVGDKGEAFWNEALTLYQRALAIRKRDFGETHQAVGADLFDIAVIYARKKLVREAFDRICQSCWISDRFIGQVFSISSENQRLTYVQKFQIKSDFVLTLAWQYLSDSPAAVRTAFDLVLRQKGITAEALAAQRDAVLSGKYPASESKLRTLRAIREQITRVKLGQLELEDQQVLAELESQKEQLEAELARQIPEVNVERKLRSVNRQVVASVLPEGTSLIEFVRFNVFDFNAKPTRGESLLKSARYHAFVLPAGEPDTVQMIDLGEAETIDRMIATFRSAITGEDESRGKRDLGALPSEPVGELDTSDGTTLRAALFDKLRPAIGNRKRLLLAPDGDLTRLPFEALPTDDGRRLIDDYQISYLGVGRDVLRFGAASSGQPTAALVAADPDFDLSGGQAQAQATSETAGELQRGRVSREIQTGDLEQLGRLPGTRVEGERIASMLGVKPLLAREALEARIKAGRTARILHLATHGFFLADQRRDPNRELRGLGLLGGQAGDGFGQMSERMSGPGMENPLLRSGVILAGFKTWLKGGSLPAEAEDGLLTAEDVSGLDLLATELVVLSACETGLGEVRTGEGVFGLRRAFVLAGAKTLVMSLWKVPDEQTRELMENFYQRILAGEPRAEALRQAQLEMKKKYPDPFYWGAFICQGEPGPLPAQGH